MKNLWNKFLFFALGLTLVIFYFQGALINSQLVNKNLENTDQWTYLIDTSKTLNREKPDFFQIGRNRMPVFHIILSFVYHPSIEIFFQRAKILNIFLSIIYLAIIFTVFKKYLPIFSAINLILITAFTVFVFRAPYVQPELTFYFLFFLCFLGLYELLAKPSIKLAFFSGIIAGVAHLTKAFILPMLVIFITMFVLKPIFLFSKNNDISPKQKWSGFLCSLVIFTLSFFVITGPYLQQSKKIFGSYFYNVNSTYYMWYDSWEEAKNGTASQNDTWQLLQMSSQNIPSAKKYFREHNFKQVQQRIENGLRENFDNIFGGSDAWKEIIYGYGKYIVIFFLSISTAVFLNFRKLRQIAKNRQSYFPILFIVLVVLIYLLLVSWYAPIAFGNRFILSLFIPLTFFLQLGFSKLVGNLKFGFRQKTISFLDIYNLFLFVSVCFDIYQTLTNKVFYINGGP